MQISKHAIERYIERTMGKTGADLKLFIVQNEDRIIEQIQKLFDSATLLYEGRLKDHGYAQSFLNKNGWVLVYDSKNDTIITIYKVDCGLDNEFNQMYVDKYRDKILTMLEELDNKNKSLKKDQEEMSEKISCNEQIISQFEQQINLLKKENTLDKDYMQLEREKINLFEKYIKSEIEKFIGNPFFKIQA